MKPSELFEALHALITERVPLHIWGACGVGKSQIVAQVASDLSWQFLDIRAVQLDPVDLRGLPRISADQAEWVPPKFLPTSGKGILFLDELTAAPQMTQAGCYQLVLDRKLGEYHLPEGWVVVAAGNPGENRTTHVSRIAAGKVPRRFGVNQARPIDKLPSRRPLGTLWDDVACIS
jgi:MoxR-like ATPase